MVLDTPGVRRRDPEVLEVEADPHVAEPVGARYGILR
jgi:hypothetical protein